MADIETGYTKPKVVFDVKMPRYEYRGDPGRSLSVDRKRKDAMIPPVDCLANIRI